ncbi:MAG TPA: DegV family protein [Lachnospiraceae bacterium]|nr:DegV family protein [Lachnospiraceae bacterium]
MGDYVLSCCSTADMPIDFFKVRDIAYLCFHFYLDGKLYVDDLGQSMKFSQLYDKMAQGSETQTSQPNVEEYREHFEKFLADGRDVIHLTLSSGISGANNSANIAAEELREKYPERKLIVIDSLAASGGFGLFVDKLADLRDEGKSIEEIEEFALKNRLRVHHWFFTTDLTYLVRGGRVSKVSGFFGNMLNICPLLNVNNEGKLIPRFKIRTKKKVIDATVEQMIMHAENANDYDGKCFITHAHCLEDAKALASLIEEKFPALKGKILINYIGTTIGAHTGPGTVALFFWGDERGE